MKAVILRAIPHGEANAINCRELARITGTEPRVIKHVISKCRREGIIICSSLDTQCGGYFFPESLDELRTYIITEQQRIDTAQAALNPAIQRLNEGKTV